MSSTDYLPARQVMDRYKITRTTLWRWVKNPDLGFPDPIEINSRRYWPESALTAWERDRAANRGAA